MTGKEKCKLLRQIRCEIARANGITYTPPECAYEGECAGTCPRCDAEVRFLDAELNRMAKEGKEITLAGVSLQTFDTYVSPKPEDDDPFDMSIELAGVSLDRGNLSVGDDWPSDESWLDESIEVLELSEQTCRNLMRANITRVIELVSYTEDDLCDELILRREDAEEAVGKLARYKKLVRMKELQKLF